MTYNIYLKENNDVNKYNMKKQWDSIRKFKSRWLDYQKQCVFQQQSFVRWWKWALPSCQLINNHNDTISAYLTIRGSSIDVYSFNAPRQPGGMGKNTTQIVFVCVCFWYLFILPIASAITNNSFTSSFSIIFNILWKYLLR